MLSGPMAAPSTTRQLVVMELFPGRFTATDLHNPGVMLALSRVAPRVQQAVPAAWTQAARKLFRESA